MGTSVGKRFGRPVFKPPTRSSKLALPFAKVGVEVEVENCSPTKMPVEVLDLWDMHEDRSLRNRGMEFTTKGGMVGTALIDCVDTLCDGLVKAKCSIGYPRAGIHLHIDVTDLNDEHPHQLANLVVAYMMFEKALFGWAGDWREGCGFCDPLTDSTKDYPDIAKLLYSWGDDRIALNPDRFSKYQAINFLPLARFGTLEFRHLPTTFDKARILKWINLCLSFKAYALNVEMSPIEYYKRQGLTGLMTAVFGEHSADIAPFVSEQEVRRAIVLAKALQIRSKLKPMLASWDPPDNPLLLKKAKQPKIEKKEISQVQTGTTFNLPDQRRVQEQFNEVMRLAANAPRIVARPPAPLNRPR